MMEITQMVIHPLREYRNRKGLSAPELAKAVGVGTETIRGIERGKYCAGQRVVCLLAEFLKLSLEDTQRLLKGERIAALFGAGAEAGGNADGHTGLRDAGRVPEHGAPAQAV